MHKQNKRVILRICRDDNYVSAGVRMYASLQCVVALTSMQSCVCSLVRWHKATNWTDNFSLVCQCLEHYSCNV